MKFSDLVFKAADCCGEHMTATIEKDGVFIGITKIGDDVFNVTFYNDKGLIRRVQNVTRDHVEAFI